MLTPPPIVSARLPAQPAGPSLVPSRPVLLLEPSSTPVAFALSLERAGVLLGVVITVWSIVRWVVRPFYDDMTLASWKRKRAEVEKFMRDEIFKIDLTERQTQKEQLARAIAVANENANSIANLVSDVAHVAAEQRAMHTVLGGIPLIAASLETMTDTLDDVARDIRETNAISREHGERIAALSALLGDDTPTRRHHTRRATDPALLDPPSSSSE